MQTYDPQLPLINLHIQKSGGQSFRKILETWFGDGFHRHHYDPRTQAVTAKVEKVDGRYPAGTCIHGHFQKRLGFGVQEYYPDIRQFITVLREPLDRQLSLYFFQKARVAKGVEFRAGQRLREAAAASVDEYLEHAMRRPPYYRNHFPWPVDEHNYKDVLEEHFVHIGVTDALQDSVRIFARKLGKPVIDVPVINTSRRDETPSAQVVERFRDTFRLEYLIYEYARGLNS